MPGFGHSKIYPSAPDFSKKAFVSDAKKVKTFVVKKMKQAYSSKPRTYKRKPSL